MRTARIALCTVEVVLSPDECCLLAEVLNEGMDYLVALDRDVDLVHMETMVAAFRAMAIAAYGQLCMPLADQRKLMIELDERALLEL